MPSLGDSAVIFFLALLLFGPKKLPELARQVGKLMGEFRRASAEFRMQMEEELRVSEQADRQKQIAAIEAAAPVTPPVADDYPAEEHPHLPSSELAAANDTSTLTPSPSSPEATPAPLPIATSGDLSIMPPATGLPIARAVNSGASIGPLLDSIPHVADREAPDTLHSMVPSETTLHG